MQRVLKPLYTVSCKIEEVIYRGDKTSRCRVRGENGRSYFAIFDNETVRKNTPNINYLLSPDCLQEELGGASLGWKLEYGED